MLPSTDGAPKRYERLIYSRSEAPLLPFVKVQDLLDPPVVSSADLPRNLAIGDNAVRFILPESYQTKHLSEVKKAFADTMSDLIATDQDLGAIFDKFNLDEPGMVHTATAKARFLDIFCQNTELAEWVAACDWGALNLPLTFVIRGVSKEPHHIVFKIDQINSVTEAEHSVKILEQALHPKGVLITDCFLVYEYRPAQRKRLLHFAYYTGVILQYRWAS